MRQGLPGLKASSALPLILTALGGLVGSSAGIRHLRRRPAQRHRLRDAEPNPYTTTVGTGRLDHNRTVTVRDRGGDPGHQPQRDQPWRQRADHPGGRLAGPGTATRRRRRALRHRPAADRVQQQRHPRRRRGRAGDRARHHSARRGGQRPRLRQPHREPRPDLGPGQRGDLVRGPVETGAKNVVDNFGTIEQINGGTVIGTSGGSGIDFYNRTGAAVEGSLSSPPATTTSTSSPARRSPAASTAAPAATPWCSRGRSAPATRSPGRSPTSRR